MGLKDEQIDALVDGVYNSFKGREVMKRVARRDDRTGAAMRMFSGLDMTKILRAAGNFRGDECGRDS
jgi:hypothetical protein